MKLDAPEARPIVKPSPVSQPESLLPVHVEKKKSRWWVWVLLLLVLGGIGYWIDTRFVQKASTRTASAAAAARRIPVVTGVASVGDLPIYLDGIGTAASLN